MNPLVLITGIVTFLICLSLHIIWWRYRHPKNDIFALILVFFLVPAIFVVAAYILHIPLINLLSIILLHTALSCAYIMSYPAVQAKCPSLNVMLIVSRAMPHGVTKEEIKQQLGDDALLDISIQKMTEEGFTKEIDNMIIPTRFGNIIASFFIVFRSLLGIEHGKG